MSPPALPRLSCSTITFRDRDLPRALETIAGLGFDRVDLGALAGLCEHVPPTGTTAQLSAVAARVRAASLAVTGVNADPGSFNTRTDHAGVRDAMFRLLDFCADAGSPRLVLTCGDPEDPGVPAAEQLRRVAGGLEPVLDRAGDVGVELTVEAPHYLRLVNTLARTDALLAALAPGITQAWDVSHVRAAGEDPAGLFPRFASRVATVHLRDALAGDIRRPMGLGDIDFPRVLRAVRTAGYRGPLVLELETHGSPFASKEEEVRSALSHLAAASAQSSEEAL
ncbi:sugar phosphate isomerase/epimerase family protein [Streptomyces rugosispiralis]|uniref:Sugar phosphate isomerase/epimerase n=1 Tax=Streptomyces rugosispiralis TaxID=2967341 RepID=A0ABT1UZQ5_9ACTN|nr:sugar phosphate isomerase/epimerase [Streptomyces rugosispiralis]MCQ8190258.1 sugar phosphate isomerase/epimerase [Streptomyces rugosispiralis]